MKKQDVQPQPSALARGAHELGCSSCSNQLHGTKGFSAQLMAKWKQRVSGEGGMLVMETWLIDRQWPCSHRQSIVSPEGSRIRKCIIVTIPNIKLQVTVALLLLVWLTLGLIPPSLYLSKIFTCSMWLVPRSLDVSLKNTSVALQKWALWFSGATSSCGVAAECHYSAHSESTNYVLGRNSHY